MQSLIKPFGAAARAVRDLVLPQTCARCGVLVGPDGGLCSDCWQALTFMSGRANCSRCAEPLEDRYGPHDGLCAHCRARPPRYDKARAALLYDDVARALILGLKHGDRLHTVPVLARLMRAAGAEVMDDADWLVPVPVHPARLRSRRFNQAAELARALAASSGMACVQALERTRPTPSQSGGRVRRARNVRDAFALAPGVGVTGRRIVLIDDVLTTGATVEACATALLEAGANRVSVLALARAQPPQDRAGDQSGALTDLRP